MELVQINVEERTETGRASMRRMRRNGKIPAVIYSGGKDATALLMDTMHYHKVVAGCRATQVFKLASKVSGLEGQMALIKDVQIDPVADRVLHIDFLLLTADHQIVVTVPIELTGQAEAVRLGEAILNQTAYELELKCLPAAIPNSVVLDISTLREGHSLHASDIALPEGTVLISDSDLTVVTLAAKEEEEAAPIVAAAAPVEGAAEGAAAQPAGAQPAAGEKADKEKK